MTGKTLFQRMSKIARGVATDSENSIHNAVGHARAKGLRLVGYRPLVGLPKHPDGSIRLAFDFAPCEMERVTTPRETAHERVQPRPKEARKVSRGVEPQPELFAAEPGPERPGKRRYA